MQLINRTTTSVFFLFALLALAGCASTKQKAGTRKWEDIFTPTTNSTPVATYGIDRTEQDYKTLESLTRELDALANEIAVTKRTILFKEISYLSDQENKRIQHLTFRFLNARGALWDMVNFYRSNTSSDTETHTKGAILGMSAGMKLNYYSSYFTALFHDQKELIKLINTAHPSYEIPRGIYDTIYDSVTSIHHLELIEVVWYLFCKDLADPASKLSILKASDPHYRTLISQMDGLYASTQIQIKYVLLSNWSSMPSLYNRLDHSHIAKLGDKLSAGISSGLYLTQGKVFKDVARIKDPRSHILQFSNEQAQQIKALLQPGDILLTYSAGYMSNVFLPGTFKHGITYIGTVDDRRAVGLTDDVLRQEAISPQQGEQLIKFVCTEKSSGGYPADIIEAVAEGVVIHSLDELLDTHINRLAVIRPQISDQERLAQLVTLFQYVGASYDFKFDFQDDSYQCCTELIYRTTDQKGSINPPLVKTRGLWILSADDLLRYYLTKNPDAFSFILLASQSSDPKNYKAEIQTGPQGLSALYQLMKLPKPTLHSR
jgi:hypothetical protein